MSGLRGDLGSSRLSPQRASGEMLEALLIGRWVKFSQGKIFTGKRRSRCRHYPTQYETVTRHPGTHEPLSD